MRRSCFSGVCSNDGGYDLAPAIDLSGKDNTRVKHSSGEEGVEVMRSGCHGDACSYSGR
ncbi:hypothetical protein IGI04_013815 [Brassica rapa subsp. trilocularis]|uniref:Uncharacterized protein n=1 Tax=Brassica rapa subsp. trilocularis TaxID=1813537 RepID=A0ABQ7NBU8_BRACM|nr:hypothetical protein IGI04_013815 [Brassica rapa subsp. trilocularis]